MKFKRLIIVPLLLSFSCAMETSQSHEEIDMDILHKEPATFPEVGSINTGEIPSLDPDIEIDPKIVGCADRFFTRLLRCLRIGQAPIDFLSLVATGGSGILSLVVYAANTSETLIADFNNSTNFDASQNATIPSYVQGNSRTLIAVAGFAALTATVLQGLRAYWQKAIADDQLILQIIHQYEKDQEAKEKK